MTVKKTFRLTRTLLKIRSLGCDDGESQDKCTKKNSSASMWRKLQCILLKSGQALFLTSLRLVDTYHFYFEIRYNLCRAKVEETFGQVRNPCEIAASNRSLEMQLHPVLELWNLYAKKYLTEKSILRWQKHLGFFKRLLKLTFSTVKTSCQC